MPIEIPKPSANIAAAQTIKVQDDCADKRGRYDGFEQVYKGFNICVFESDNASHTTVLRIVSFRYREAPKESKIQSLKDEVEQFYEKYWKAKAPTTKKLIIDLIDNGGGDTPVAWYKIFYDKPFQEEYVQFKKIAELEDD